MDVLQELYKLQNPCIYAFLNRVDNRVFIGFSNNIIETLNRTIHDVKSGVHLLKDDFDKLELSIIETVPKNIIRLRYEYWVAKYRNNGWEHYRNFKAVDYKVRVGTKFFEHKMWVHVYLKTRGRRVVTLGLFEKYGEASQFIETHYAQVPYANIVLAPNDVTSRYVSG